MKSTQLLVLAAFFTIGATYARSTPSWSKEIDVAYKKYTLPNGLRLIVHEDRKAPMVAVNTWYHIGSKNERAGRTGFAHLFEHLMFNGSKNHNDDYFKALDKVGATGINGSTGFDRTNYFQVVPTSGLDTVLWMESDRMGNLLGALDQKRLDEQRGVVQNEKRQKENQPYGKAYEIIYRSIYPKEHPYSWLPIGSMEDLNAAALDDVREWFKAYYGAANAVVSIAGDVNAEEVRKKVEHYYGWIPSGPAIARPQRWIAKRSESTRASMQDRVPLARIYKYWNMPDVRSLENEDLNLFSDVLAGGKNSRLYKRLVYQDQIASDVSASVSDGEIGGQFEIIATAKEGQSLAKVERAIDEELARVLRDGVQREELESQKTQFHAMMVRGLEKIGGYSGKAELLLGGEVFHGDPAHYKAVLDRIQGLTPKSLTATARKWLANGDFTLEVHPFVDRSPTADTVDRKAIPYPKSFETKDFPGFRRRTLRNGLKLALLERKQTPIVDLNLVLGGGYVGERGLPRGAGKLAMSLLTEGTEKYPALELSDRLERIATSLSASIGLNAASVRLSSMSAKLDESLDLFAQAVLRPGFRADDLVRVQKRFLDGLAYEKSSPESLALRVLPRLYYGEGHPYAIPGSGLGDEASIRALATKDARDYYDRWFRPEGATLVAVGDFAEEDLVRKLESRFGGWKARGPAPAKIEIPPAAAHAKTEIYLIDRPDSLQSLVTASHAAPAKTLALEPALVAMNLAFGGSFNSRINMNLREDKHWSYGARAGFTDTIGVRQFSVSGSVQTDKTAPSMEEIRKEIANLRKGKPLTADELSRSKIAQTVSFANSWETNASIVGYLSSLTVHGLPDDYYVQYPKRAQALALADAQATASLAMDEAAMVWLIVGDRARIEKSMRDLKWADVVVVDTDGKRLN